MSGATRPADSELAPHARIYVDQVPRDADIAELLSTQWERTIGLLRSFGEGGAGELVYAPGKWTVKQVTGHMSDTERIMAYRALRLGRGDQTPLPGFEQDDYMAPGEFHRRTLDDLVGEFKAVREATLALVRGFPAAAWDRRGVVSNFPVTVRGLVFTIAGHELHHARILEERYVPLLR